MSEQDGPEHLPPPARPLRVLYVSETGVLGGAGKSLLRLLESLDPAQVQADVAAPDGAMIAAADELGIPGYPLPECRLRRTLNPLLLWRQLHHFLVFCRSLGSVCELLRPDLVHANGPVAAWAAVRCTGVPVIWHVRDLRLPRRLMRLVRRKAAAVVAISRAVADYVAAEAPHGAPVQVIHNGLTSRDTAATRSRHSLRREWGIPADAPLIGYMGQVVPWKRQDVLLRAMPAILQALPEARLVLIGDDAFRENREYAAELRRLVDDLGLRQAVAWVAHTAEPASALAALDVLAHPAEKEPFGRVVLEALAVGTPVVAINRAGPAEILEDGESGLLVPPLDPPALAKAVLRVLEGPELAESLRQGGLRRAEDFSQETLTPTMVHLYRDIMSDDGRR
ncbi:MAG: glycosyltransferase family 4 protein [Armatimonadia bacterium]